MSPTLKDLLHLHSMAAEQCTPPLHSADTRPSNGGHVYYMITTDSNEVASLKSTLFTTNPLPGFSPLEAMVATWDVVGYYM